ncbi:unnamed protein product (macronuclear) [Paramecium tetraurelia]|uniref:CCT domain-containing protein n=1 Tax=Paramecium tetraurelia TaxID=5888 RepID=A0BZA3_PARTE|nr:uncharacterized protein GSPATT00033723001 [Paramecium tetraurelia]CAK63870.1 unnamed protein product [Paramecium tetraurelia]|eukprot:XP_001431268.1 hypothetical protein (macronuclear) [Paramecium tetraurelia strain d4-2]
MFMRVLIIWIQIKRFVKENKNLEEEMNTQNNEVLGEKLENVEKENSFTYQEPHYQVDQEMLEEQQDDIQLQVYSPQQLLQFKKQKPVHFDEFILDEDPKKKVCIQWQNSIVEQSEHHPIGDLERLAEQLQRENHKKFSYPKDLPAPQNEDIRLDDLSMRFSPSIKQDEFISNYVKKDDLLRIKVGLCYEILNDEETLKFEDWVEQLCTSTNYESLKEMARKQKVKRYLEKKHNRTYEKKVHYHIRQKVAEERLRIKGRFVTWGQALKMLNGQDQKKPSCQSDYIKIKDMMNERFVGLKSKKSLKF